MGSSFFPDMVSSSLSPGEALRSVIVLQVVGWIALGILFWDWLWSFKKERSLAWAAQARRTTGRTAGAVSWRRRLSPGVGAMKYLAIGQAVFYVSTLSLPSTCDRSRFLPFGFSAVSFTTHVVMSLRMFGLSGHSTSLLLGLLAASALDLGVQLGVDGFVQPVHVVIPTSSGAAVFRGCILQPSASIFALAFISPSVFHHIILGITCYYAHRHMSHESVLGGTLMRSLRTHHAFYAVCLANFLNVILVLQSGLDEFRLLNYLPALCITQILSGRIYFAIRELHVNPVSGAPQAHFTSTTSDRGGKLGAPGPSRMNGGVSFLHFGGRRNRGEPSSRGNHPAPITRVNLSSDHSTLKIRISHRAVGDEVGGSFDPGDDSGYRDMLSAKALETPTRPADAGSISTLGSVIFDGRDQGPDAIPLEATSYESRVAGPDYFFFPTPPPPLRTHSSDVERLTSYRSSSPAPSTLQARRNASPTPLVITSTPLTSFPPKQSASPRRLPRPRTSSVTTAFPPTFSPPPSFPFIDSTNLSPPNTSRLASPHQPPSPLSATPLLSQSAAPVPGWHPYTRSSSRPRKMSSKWDVPPLPALVAPFPGDDSRWEEVPLDVPQDEEAPLPQRRSSMPGSSPMGATDPYHGARWI